MIFPFEVEQKEAEKRITSLQNNIFRHLFSKKKENDEKRF